MIVASSRITLSTGIPFSRVYGGARGKPFDRRKFHATYVKGSCTCEPATQAAFWLEKAMLQRTRFHYCCPFCGEEHVMADPSLMEELGVTPR